MTFIPFACPTIPDLKSLCELKKCLMNASVRLEPAHTFQQELIAHTSSQLCLQWHSISNLKSAIIRLFMPWNQQTLHIRTFFSLGESLVQPTGCHHWFNPPTECLPLGDCVDSGKWDTVLLSGTSRSRSRNPLLEPKPLLSALFFSSLTLAHLFLSFFSTLLLCLWKLSLITLLFL